MNTELDWLDALMIPATAEQIAAEKAGLSVLAAINGVATAVTLSTGDNRAA